MGWNGIDYITVLMSNDFPLETVPGNWTEERIRFYCQAREAELQRAADKMTGGTARKIYVHGYKVPFIENP